MKMSYMHEKLLYISHISKTMKNKDNTKDILAE